MAVLEYVDLTLEELKSLAEKAEKTVFTMAVSPIEVHGPHLPLGTDILIATAVRDRVQYRVSQRIPTSRLSTCRLCIAAQMPSRIQVHYRSARRL